MNSPNPRKGYFRNGGPSEVFVCCSVDLAVRVIEAGKPKKGELITYTLPSLGDYGSFDEKDSGTTKIVSTNSKGYAEVEYWAGSTPGIVTITATGMSSSLSPSSGFVDITVKGNDPSCPAVSELADLFDNGALATIRCDGENGFVYDEATTLDVDNVEFNIGEFADALAANSRISHAPTPAELDELVELWLPCIEQHELAHKAFFELRASEGNNRCKGCACNMAPPFPSPEDCKVSESGASSIEVGCLRDALLDPDSIAWIILDAIIKAIDQRITDDDFPNC